MDKADFLLRLDELLELDPGTLKGAEILEDLEAWDSMSILGFIALVDEIFGVTLSASKLAACETIEDLVGLLNGQISE